MRGLCNTLSGRHWAPIGGTSNLKDGELDRKGISVICVANLQNNNKKKRKAILATQSPI